MWTLNGKKNRKTISQLEALALKDYTPAVELINVRPPKSPLILASPHSGRLYADGFVRQTSLKTSALRLGEDCYIDTVFKPLAAHGVPFLHALFPRCFVDVNRHADEWPVDNIRKNLTAKTPSPRARSGLGVVPTHISHNLGIYTQPLRSKHIQARLDTLYHPYHRALNTAIQAAKAQFGRAVLLDCHSMPGQFVSGVKRADFILGDRYGQSCRAETMDMLHNTLQSLGYVVTRNIPYAGGYITQHYGQPEAGVEVIQMEINKDLYLDPHTLETHDGMEALAKNMESLVVHMIDILGQDLPIAAQ